MNLNLVPIIGWILSLFFALSMAVPFYFFWNAVAPTYFYWLPMVYQHLPFWDIVMLFVSWSIVKSVLFPTLVLGVGK